MRPLFPFPAPGTWHHPTAVPSARERMKLEPKCLAVGHGRLVLDPLEAIVRVSSRRGSEVGKGEGS